MLLLWRKQEAQKQDRKQVREAFGRTNKDGQLKLKAAKPKKWNLESGSSSEALEYWVESGSYAHDADYMVPT